MYRMLLLFAMVNAVAGTCPADRRKCPDGSYVSRDPGNDCSFRPCPTQTKWEVALLRVANTASFDTLHYTVDIWKRKTMNIIAARPFATIAELKAVPEMSDVVLALLLTYTHKSCPDARPLPTAGTWEGVDFTAEQAAGVLEMVNGAPFKLLHKTVGIYKSTVTRIFRARPMCTMKELWEVYGVGRTVLTLLRDYSDVLGRDCRDHADCTSEDRCVGKNLQTEFGKCRPRSRIPGENERCNGEKPCMAGLWCSKYERCSPGWMQTTLWSDGPLAITGPKQEHHIVVYGQATVPVDVRLSMKVAHSSPRSLRITLHDPYSNNVATYWDGTKENFGWIPDSKVMGNSGDAQINGKWTLIVENVDGKGSGEVTWWSLYLTSRWD